MIGIHGVRMASASLATSRWVFVWGSDYDVDVDVRSWCYAQTGIGPSAENGCCGETVPRLVVGKKKDGTKYSSGLNL
jgi:hypothetical protein